MRGPLGGCHTRINYIRNWPLLLITLTACRAPQAESVRADFVRVRPGAEVLEVVPTEGDASHAYYRVRFRDTAGSAVSEEEWGYRRSLSGGWELFTRDSAQSSKR